MKKKSKKVSTQPFPWETLTWDDLLAWTDSRSLERGRSYHRRGAVENLNLLPDGGLLADVSGTHRYATRITFAGRSRDLSQRLEAVCSCPVGQRCKHSVAVILEFLDAIENNRTVPEADENDRRLTQIENAWEDEYSDNKFDDDEYDDVDFPLTQASDQSVYRSPRTRKKKTTGGKARSKRKFTDTDIVSFLSAMSKDELVGIIMQVCRGDAKLRQDYIDRIMLETGDHAVMIGEARKELRSITSEEAWYNSWEGYGNLPNYSRLRSQLRSLVDAKQFDAVIELGRELIQRGMGQVEQSNDEGETAEEIMSAVSIVAEAIIPCSLTDVDKILFVIDSFLQDDYDLCDSFSHLLNQRFPEAAWAEIAENLQSRLPSKPTSKKSRTSADFISSYQRERLSEWIIPALEASGATEAATNFCIEEATQAGSYQRAVDRLITLKRYHEANELALLGLQNTDPMYAGLINRLQDSLATIAAKNKDYSVAAALAAERFVANPSTSSLSELLKAAKKEKCEAVTKAVAMHFLETGQQPEFTKLAKSKSHQSKKSAKPRTDCWPFPTPPGSINRNASPSRDRAKKPSPHFHVLIRLSIQQHDSESVLRWYDQWRASAPQDRVRFYQIEIEIADAISSTFPDRAVELYLAEADRLAAKTSTNLYPESVSFLKKAHNVLKSENRDHEFDVILMTFQNHHHRKRRLVELLHSLEGHRS